MKNRILFLMIATVAMFRVNAQNNDTKIILITLDGFRWQELFTGADSLLIGNKDYVHEPEMLKKAFWRDTPSERREALLPFFWSQVVKMGQIHGNRKLESKVDLTNSMWFSYPGYNEILTGTADDKNIRSNNASSRRHSRGRRRHRRIRSGLRGNRFVNGESQEASTS